MIFKASKNTISFMTTIILFFSSVGSGFADSSNSVKIAKDSERQNGKIIERYKHRASKKLLDASIVELKGREKMAFANTKKSQDGLMT